MTDHLEPYCPECGSEFACNCEEVTSVLSTFRSLPSIEPGETAEQRLAKLMVWCESLDGYLYSVGSALTELRKEQKTLTERLRGKPL
jgi:hypothetical protein